MTKIKRFRLRHITIPVAMVAVLIFILPYTVSVAWVKSRIAATVNSSLQGDFGVESMAWSWFPIPGLAVEKLRVSNPVIDVTVANGVIQLSPLSLISDRKHIAITLRQPDINIRTLVFHPKEAKGEQAALKDKEPSRSSLDINIRKGNIHLPSDGFLAPLAIQGFPLEIFDIDASLSLKPESLTVDSTCRLTFAEAITANITVKKQPKPDTGKLSRYWDMDIRGQGLNLTDASEKIMLLFGTNKVAQTVCGIVQGGRAKTGGFTFKGYTDDFKNIKAMHIEAVADKATIQVPGVDLHLVEAGGPIAIENGILTGNNLSATLGHSYGKNGDIALALTGKNRAFHLALDLSADMSELPVLLRENLIKNAPQVTEELNRISRSQGHADARLVIGDTLDAMEIAVTVLSSDSAVIYDRLRHPVRIEQGEIRFTPGECSWNGIKAGIGPHAVDTSTGRVTWKDGVLIDVTSTNASIDSGEFLSEIKTYAPIREKLCPRILSMDGRINLSGLTVNGNVQKPSELIYGMTMTTDGLTVDSQVIQGNAVLKNASLTADNKGFMLEKGLIEINGTDGTIKGLTALSKVLTFINVTELLALDTWRYMLSEGFHYSELLVVATVTNNRIAIDEAYVKGHGLDLFALGTVDLTSQSMELCVFAEPLKLIGSLADVIHLEYSKKDSITLIPIKVSGPFGDPDVDISNECRNESKASSLKSMVKRTLSFPGRWIRGVMPAQGDN